MLWQFPRLDPETIAPMSAPCLPTVYRQLIEAEQGDRQHLEQLRSRATEKAEIVRDFLNESFVD